MTRSKSPLLLASLLTLGVSIAPAHAQQARSFVSGLGNDANAPNCTRTAPCRTFQVAHDNTLVGGEITVIDVSSYGAVTINRDISIVNNGAGEAGILVSGGNNGITINAGATDIVTLRGITIKGIGAGSGNGIVFNTGAVLIIQNCAISRMTGASPLGVGITFLPNANATFAVSNTQVIGNQGGGILVFPSAGTGILVSAVLDGVGLYNNGPFGFLINGSNTAAAGRVTATISNSVAGNNGINGFAAASAAAPAAIRLTNSVAAGNGVGLNADTNSTITVGGSTLTSNIVNLTSGNGGTVDSWGNNYQVANITTNPFNGMIPLQ